MKQAIAWGAKVSRTFIERVLWIAEDLQIGADPLDGCNLLMGCMAWESNRTFTANVRNMAGSGATGLIQFMPDTAKALGTTVEKLAAMTAENQLNYVWKYFEPYKGKLKTLGDVYMAILWPRGVGQPETYVLWDKASRPTTYRQNAGLDVNKDGVITKAEAVAKVAERFAEGMKSANLVTVDYTADAMELPTPVHVGPYTKLTEPAVDEPAAPVSVPAVVDTVSETAQANVTELAKQLPRSTVVAELDRAPAGVVEHVTTATKLKLGEKSTWVGGLIVVGSVLADPSVAAAIRPTVEAVKAGHWGGILSAILGLGLVIARSRSTPRTDAMIAAKRIIDPG